jgi:4-hydroxy-3-methylbut-2-enyl diphosphate reductase
VHHVQTANDLRLEWFEGAQAVGITAGTSTPDGAIAEVERWLLNLAARLGPAVAREPDHLKAA